MRDTRAHTLGFREFDEHERMTVAPATRKRPGTVPTTCVGGNEMADDTRELEQALRERDEAVEALQRVVANESNHYDRYWTPPPESVTDEWLDATEAKMREALGDAFCDDAAAVMLTLIAEIRRSRSEVLIEEGWWHPNAVRGVVHEHPESPGGNWSAPMHRMCERVYTKRESSWAAVSVSENPEGAK